MLTNPLNRQFLPNLEKLKMIVQRVRNGYLIVAVALVLALLLLNSCKKQEEQEEDNLPAIRVKVLNGSGFSGVANEMRNHLMKFNIDVIDVGNADRFIYNRTIIVVKRDDEQDLERLMRYTNIRRRTYALSNEADESFQIIVGKDYLNYIK